jgi:hypothetical protein
MCGDWPTLNLRVLLLKGSAGVDRVHPRELIIERVERQQATSHTHVISIASKCRANNQKEGCSEEGISSKAKERFQTHGDVI